MHTDINNTKRPEKCNRLLYTTWQYAWNINTWARKHDTPSQMTPKYPQRKPTSHDTQQREVECACVNTPSIRIEWESYTDGSQVHAKYKHGQQNNTIFMGKWWWRQIIFHARTTWRTPAIYFLPWTRYVTWAHSTLGNEHIATKWPPSAYPSVESPVKTTILPFARNYTNGNAESAGNQKTLKTMWTWEDTSGGIMGKRNKLTCVENKPRIGGILTYT